MTSFDVPADLYYTSVIRRRYIYDWKIQNFLRAEDLA